MGQKRQSSTRGSDATHPPSTEAVVSLFRALPLWPTQGPEVGQACYRSFQLSCDCIVARKRPRIDVALELAACCLLKALALSHLHAEQFQMGQHLFHGQLIYPTSASVQWRTWTSARALYTTVLCRAMQVRSTSSIDLPHQSLEKISISE